MDTLLYIFLFLVSIFIFLISKRSSKRCPPGSRGLPFMGQSLGLLRAMKNNTTEKWLEDRVRKYGPVSKLSLFGKPAVFIYGQAANKLVFAGEGSTTGYHQPKSMIKIMGESSLLGLSGQDHKRVRHALMSILKPESLREYVGRIDEEMRNHLEMHWEGKQEVTKMSCESDEINSFLMLWTLIAALAYFNRRGEGGGGGDDIYYTKISNKQVQSIKMILGDRNLLELSGQDHKRVRNALMMFLKPESLKEYVGKIDEEVREHLQMHWQGKQEVTIFWVTNMTHNDDTIFPEPLKFDTTRFEKQASIPPYSFIPFGGGARICPGYEVARIETLVTIHYLVTQYTWKLCSDNFFKRDPMPVPTKGLPIKIVPRKVI
ncbi:hypothetical protein HS088_TW19G00151 [Tripterygium wilfordii]|uniref:Uncharacterized protein n=1 Tax=Tripterygium wilfordii TaxID=458696 RepID=A0A7J7C8Y7_TRIWF|nr:hypothetical protein HS088_TW19G00151 [Tripterygium wilfordii]